MKNRNELTGYEKLEIRRCLATGMALNAFDFGPEVCESNLQSEFVQETMVPGEHNPVLDQTLVGNDNFAQEPFAQEPFAQEPLGYWQEPFTQDAFGRDSFGVDPFVHDVFVDDLLIQDAIAGDPNSTGFGSGDFGFAYDDPAMIEYLSPEELDAYFGGGPIQPGWETWDGIESIPFGALDNDGPLGMPNEMVPNDFWVPEFGTISFDVVPYEQFKSDLFEPIDSNISVPPTSVDPPSILIPQTIEVSPGNESIEPEFVNVVPDDIFLGARRNSSGSSTEASRSAVSDVVIRNEDVPRAQSAQEIDRPSIETTVDQSTLELQSDSEPAWEFVTASNGESHGFSKFDLEPRRSNESADTIDLPIDSSDLLDTESLVGAVGDAIADGMENVIAKIAVDASLPAQVNWLSFTTISTITPLSTNSVDFSHEIVTSNVESVSIELSSLARILAMVSSNAEDLISEVPKQNMIAVGVTIGAACGVTYVAVKSNRSKQEDEFRCVKADVRTRREA